MQIGTSVASATVRSMAASSSDSSTSGMPALTSSMSAPASHLGEGVDGHGREVAAAQLLGERLAPRGVDALADDAERLVVADDDGARA